MEEFYTEYFKEYKDLTFSQEVFPVLNSFHELAISIKQNNGKLMFAGNGASAAISAHGAVDFTKQAKVRSVTFNEADLITCYANDYGYDNWMAEAISSFSNPGDALVLISVSGESPSVINAAKQAHELGLKVVTFSGRHENNSLKALGDINFWVDSHAYNIVECIHMIWLTTVIDAVVGKAVYEVS